MALDNLLRKLRQLDASHTSHGRTKRYTSMIKVDIRGLGLVPKFEAGHDKCSDLQIYHAASYTAMGVQAGTADDRI